MRSLRASMSSRDSESREQSFDTNSRGSTPLRVRKLVDDSHEPLLGFSADGAPFDLVYVDGSHLGLDVLVDAALAWRLLDSQRA